MRIKKRSITHMRPQYPQMRKVRGTSRKNKVKVYIYHCYSLEKALFTRPLSSQSFFCNEFISHNISHTMNRLGLETLSTIFHRNLVFFVQSKTLYLSTPLDFVSWRCSLNIVFFLESLPPLPR